MSILKQHTTVGEAFPQVIPFFQNKLDSILAYADLPEGYEVEVIKAIASVDIYLMNGLLFQEQDACHALFFDGDETEANVYLNMRGDNIELEIPLGSVCIMISDYGDHTFKEATVVHELAHYFKNLIEGAEHTEGADYETDRNEVIARDFEEQYLRKNLNFDSRSVIQFMKQKYFPGS